MGRYSFAAQNVHKHASQLLQVKQIKAPPPWYEIVGALPPAKRLIRPAMQRPQNAGKRSSKLFKPLSLVYEEDKLRWEYFNDHPWELARPRVMLENDGRDHERYDWGLPLDHSLNRPLPGVAGDPHRTDHIWEVAVKTSSARPINGEAVVQRQAWLMREQEMSESAAYDKARTEFYNQRHAKEIENRVAKEEALAYGAFFDPGALEIGMLLEDQQYENWKEWAIKESNALKQLQQSAYSEGEAPEDATAPSALA